MGPYQAFCHEQRPLLERDICPGEREKLLGRLWKALSKAEKAHYKMEEVRPSPYSLFCQGQRPLLPPDLPGATREMVLGRLWAVGYMKGLIEATGAAAARSDARL